MLRDIHLALRRFWFRPAQTVLMILILGLGIGATTAVFSVVDQTVLRAAPFAHADRMVQAMDWDRVNGGGGSSLTPAKIAGWQAQRSLFEAFEGYTVREFDVTGDAEPERIQGLIVSNGLFNMLGVQPRLGRGFAQGDGLPGSERVVLISEALWTRRLAGRSDVLGARVSLNDEWYTVVGVMPRRFRLTGDKESVWLPYDVPSHVADVSMRSFYGLARLAPGVPRGSAQKQADTIADRLQEQTALPQTWGLRLEPKKVAWVTETTRAALFVLLGAVGFVLLITCANTANLFLSQVAVRQREMAIRTAIGAARSRLIREVLTESVLLSACGGVVGVLLAIWGVDAIVAAAPANLTFQATSPIEIDARILAVAAAITIANGIVFGLMPALRGSRPHLDVILKGTSGTGGTRYSRFAGGLIVAEVAFSLILLVAAALMMRTFVNLGALEPGFEPRGVVAMEIGLPTDKYPSSAARVGFLDALSARLSAIAGVSHVAIADGVPPGGGGIHFGTPGAEGSTTPAVGQELVVPSNSVSPDYFRMLRIPLVAGRFFTADDPRDTLIVTRALADRYWPDGTAVGRRFRPYDRAPWQTIVGVVGNVDSWSSDKRTPFHMYNPWPAPTQTVTTSATPRPRSYSRRVVLVRAEDATAVIPAIKAAVWSIDKGQPIDRVTLVEDAYADTFARQRFVLELMSAFGIIAVLLTVAGLFGVLSEIVARRTREIGIRMALGAGQADVLRLVLWRGIALALGGTALGLVGAFALMRFLEALLFEVRPLDPVSFVSVSVAMLVIALLACWIPARRAMGVGPADALRVE